MGKNRGDFVQLTWARTPTNKLRKTGKKRRRRTSRVKTRGLKGGENQFSRMCESKTKMHSNH